MSASNAAAGCELSLVIPCYNEAKNLPLLIERIEQRFAPDGATEVLLVDNGSSDETPRILAERLTAHPVLRSVRVERNQGYGYGILAGLAAAQGRFLGWTHADMQTDPADALEALRRIRSSPWPERLYVKGRRYGRPLADVAFTVGMSAFESLLLRRPLWDINAQPNVFPREFYRAVVDGAPHDFSLDLYFYHEARRQRFVVERFPVRFGARAHGVSHWNVDFRSKTKFIKRTLKFSIELRSRLSSMPAP